MRAQLAAAVRTEKRQEKDVPRARPGQLGLWHQRRSEHSLKASVTLGRLRLSLL